MMKNNKKQFEDSELEIIKITLQNVITASGDPEQEKEEETPKMNIT